MRQPFADQILRGKKRFEDRGRATTIRGRVYIYATNTPHSEAGEPFPRAVIVGTVEVHECRKCGRRYEWLLRKPRRLVRPFRPKRKPQPVWSYPFGR